MSPLSFSPLPTLMMRTSVVSAAAFGAAVACAQGASVVPVVSVPGASVPVVAIVRVPKPWYAPRSFVAFKMRATTAQYAALPGLAFKAYTIEQSSGDFGGVYYWRDRALAQAWFNDAWFTRVRSERGVEGRVVLLDAPVSIDNTKGGTLAVAESDAVATWVEVPIPASLTTGLDDAQLAARLQEGFRAAVPQYQAVPGLLRKHFTQDARVAFGGVYLWRDAQAARAFHTAEWAQAIQARWGAAPRVTWFDATTLLLGRDAAMLPATAIVAAQP